MKKHFILLTTLLLISFGANAQLRLGGGLAFGTEIENLGIRAQADIPITDQISIAPNITYFFTDDGGIDGFSTNFFTINGDAHYNIDLDNFIFYPLAGLNITIVSVDIDIPGIGSESASDSEFGLNVGAGGELPISDSFSLNAEIKYVISSADQLVIAVGALFAL